MHELPTDVKIGMDVYDRDDNLIGKVEDLRFADPAAAESTSPDGERQASLIDNLADALWSHDMPEAQRSRLLQEGYILLDAKGILHGDRYILPEQIASVRGDKITLTGHRDDLQKA